MRGVCERGVGGASMYILTGYYYYHLGGNLRTVMDCWSKVRVRVRKEEGRRGE